MRDYLLIFKTLLKNQYSARIGSNGKKRLPQGLVMILSMLPLVLMLCVVLVFLALALPDIYALANLINAVMTASQMFILFTMLAGVMNTLYSSPDTPFLSSLPLKAPSIFLAKFSLTYVSALTVSTAFIPITALAVSIAYASVGNHVFYGFYPLVFLITLLAPLLPLTIIVLFSMPLNWIGSFFKGRAVLKSVFSIIFYVALMCVYLVVIYVINTPDITQGIEGEISVGTLGSLSSIATIMYPNKVLIFFCLGIDPGKNFGISLGIHIGMLVITLLLAVLFYRRISTRKLETKQEESRKTASYKKNGIIAALIKRDVVAIMRNSSMAMSCFGSILLAPLFMGLMYFAGNASMSQDVGMLVSDMMSISLAFTYSSIFLCGSNMFSGLAYTREGQSFFISKALPIRARDSVLSKLILSCVVTLPSLLVCLILALFVYKINIVSTLLYAICSLMLIFGMNCINIYVDMRRGNVNWKTAADMRNASKGNAANILVVFLALVPSICMFTLAATIGTVEATLGRIGVFAVFWSVVGMVCAVMAVVGGYVLKEKGVPLYDIIGENKKTAYMQYRSSLGERGGKGGMLG